MKISHNGETYHISFVSTFEPSLGWKAEGVFRIVGHIMGKGFAGAVRKLALEKAFAKREDVKMIISDAPVNKISQVRVTTVRLDKEVMTTGDVGLTYQPIAEASTKQSIEDADNKTVGKSIAMGRLLKVVKLGDEFNSKVKEEFAKEFSKKKKVTV